MGPSKSRRTLPHFQHLAENRNRGRPNDATNARLVPGEPPGRYVGTLLSSLEPAQRFQPRIKRYPQHHTVRGMDSELWRRRHRPIPSVRHVLTTAALCLLPACSERVNQVWSQLCASARGYGDTRGTEWSHPTYTMLNVRASSRLMSPPQPQPPHQRSAQTRPAHAHGNPSRCDHISQSLLTTTSHTATGCGTTRRNNPMVQTTRPMSPPQPQPPHQRSAQTRPAHAHGNPSRCDHISQSLLTTTSHTATGCGTTRRNNPMVQTTRPMSPPQPQPPHQRSAQTRPAHAHGNPSRCDHISQSLLTTTSHTATGCGTTRRNNPMVQTTRPMSPPQPQPPHQRSAQTRPAHAHGNPSRCDHISQSLLTTTSHTATGCGTTRRNNPMVQTTRPMSPPQPQPPHQRSAQTRPAHAHGNPSRCDHISQSLLTTTSHTATGCGTTRRNNPMVQTTRPMSPPQPQPPHQRSAQTRPAHAHGNPSRCDHISQSLLTTTSHTATGCGTTRRNNPMVQTTRPMSPPQPQPPHQRSAQTRPAHAHGNPSRCDHISQSLLTTTSHTATGCGTTRRNNPMVQTTRPMSPPQPQPPHQRSAQTRPAHAHGNPSRCDHISQSLLTTTSHTATGCGTTRRNNPMVQTTRPMSPPQPQPPHRVSWSVSYASAGLCGCARPCSRCLSNGNVPWYHTVDMQSLIHRPGTLTRPRHTIFVRRAAPFLP